MGKCFSSNCPAPLNCNPVKCPKEQIICTSICDTFFSNGGFLTFGTANNLIFETEEFDGSICITNDGPGIALIRITEKIGSLPNLSPILVQTFIFVQPGNGAFIVFENAVSIFGVAQTVGGDPISGRYKMEIQKTIKLRC